MAIPLDQAPWRYWAQQSPNRIALIDGQRELSWAQLADEVSAVVTGLQAQGLSKGDVITIVGKNHMNSLLLLLAAQELGVCTAFTMEQPPTSLQIKLETLYHVLQPRYVWLNGRQLEPENRTLSNLKEGTNRQHGEAYQAKNLATIVFTSGSTGTPKAVAHTHEQHFSSAQGLLEKLKFTQQDCWLLSLPLYHVSGLAIVYRWLKVGAKLKLASADLSDNLQGVTHASLVVTQLQRLIESQCFGSLTHVLLGGSHIPHAITKQAQQHGIKIWFGYGMTETASTVTAKQVDEYPSAGWVLPNREVHLNQGRIYIRGKVLASGYYHQGTVTPLVKDDGWFDTKDLGRWHNDELCILGRADNQFISGGENIHCEEIEASLIKHPEVLQAIVVPVEDKAFGQRPVAIIQKQSALCTSELNGFLADHLERFKFPIAYYDMPESAHQGGIKISRAYLKQWMTQQWLNQ